MKYGPIQSTPLPPFDKDSELPEVSEATLSAFSFKEERLPSDIANLLTDPARGDAILDLADGKQDSDILLLYSRHWHPEGWKVRRKELLADIKRSRESYPRSFIIVQGNELDPVFRFKAIELGANAFASHGAHDMEHIAHHLFLAAGYRLPKSDVTLTCPVCEKGGLSEDALWVHLPLFHRQDGGRSLLQHRAVDCPMCSKDGEHVTLSGTELQRHYQNSHGPKGRGVLPNAAQLNPATYIHAFALCVVQRARDVPRYDNGKVVRTDTVTQTLLVQERSCEGFWLPGGRVDSEEDLDTSAIRETYEEAGVNIAIDGILRVAYTPFRGAVRLRVIFKGHVLENDRDCPKYIPDFESTGSLWASDDEIEELHRRGFLRGDEPFVWSQYLAKGGSVAPLSLLTTEGARPRVDGDTTSQTDDLFDHS